MSESPQHARRLWITDRQLTSIAIDHREDLGDWIKRRMQKGVKEKEAHARNLLNQCGRSMAELDQQWSRQKTAQQSVSSCKFACQLFRQAIIHYLITRRSSAP